MFLKIWQDIKKKKFAPLYLLYGKEDFLIQETKNLIIHEALDEQDMDLNLNVYDMEETGVEIAVEDCETIPFFGERKVVVIQNAYFLTASKETEKDKVEHNVKVLEQYATSPVPSTILIIAAPYEKLDERKRITKTLKKQATVLEAKELSEQEAIQWMLHFVEERGGAMDREGAERLFQLIGPNLAIIHNELNKLLLYSDGALITDQMVEQMVAKSLEDNIFDLVDNVVQKRLDKCLEIYHDLLKQNEEPIKIVAVIASQLRLLYQVKTLMDKGFGQKQIASQLKVHPFRVKLAMGKTKQFPLKKILQMLNDLADMDYRMKTGGGNREKLLELFFMRHIH